MRLITIKQCKPGMRLAKRIFSEEGLVLLGERMELTDRLIKRLEQSHIYYLYVEDEFTSDLEVNPLISDETFSYAIKEVKKNFEKMMTSSDRNKFDRPFIAQPLKSVMNNILDELLDNKDGMVMLMNMATVDNYLYQHSLNVCVYTSLLASQNGLSRDQLHHLGLGAMLHDVGKTLLDIDILKKTGSLTGEEYEHIKLHTTYGYQILKEQPNLPLSVAHCAFQHHERIDGSGYPRGIKGDEISEGARWIGIVDSYDAMTTNRIYRSPILPHDAMERLFAGSGTLYDHNLLTVFRDKVVLYPIGISVKLSNGLSGVVVDFHRSYPHRPIVRILKDEEDQILSTPYEIDMSIKLNVMITHVNDEVISS